MNRPLYWCTARGRPPPLGISSVHALGESGRRVFNALLTGLEADAHALTEAVTLETHTRDVVALLEREALHDVVLAATATPA